MDNTQNTQGNEEVSGLMVKSMDGTVYFVPKQVLEACLLPAGIAAEAWQSINSQGGDVEGYMSGGEIARLVRLNSKYARTVFTSLSTIGFSMSRIGVN